MQQEDDRHWLQRWFSIGDAVSLVVVMVGLGSVYGSLSQRLSDMQQDVAELRGRDITPGARSELARNAAVDIAQDRQIAEMRVEMREQRREIIESLARLEAKLDNHDRGRSSAN